MRFFVCTAIFLVLIGGSGAFGREIFPEIPEKKRTLLLQLGGEWYDSIANYTSAGKFVRLPAENFFQYLSVDPRVKFTPYKWVSLTLSTGLMYGKSGGYDEAGSKAVFRDRLQFTVVSAGISFHSRFKSLYVIAGIKGGFPLNRFDRLTQDNIITGDGAYAVEPGIWLIYALSPRFVYLFYNTSFKYRTQRLSSLSFHKAGGFVQTRSLDAGFSADFFFPLIQDGYTKRPETRWNTLKRVNGSSYKFFSVNPSALSFTVWMAFKPLKSFEVKLYTNLDTYGQYYGKGYTMGLFLSKKFTGKSFTDRLRFKQELRRFKHSGEERENSEGGIKDGEGDFFEDEDMEEEENLPEEMLSPDGDDDEE